MIASSNAYPRPLSDREAETLRFMLSPDDPRLVPLRQQADTAVVVGMCPCGCATIDFAVDRESAQPAPGLHSAVVNAGTPQFDANKGPHEFILFLDHGWLSSLEVVYYSSEPPVEFPPIDDFEPPYLTA
jgi:hypothetical protein